jgi:opacity protein-like surface antigen
MRKLSFLAISVVFILVAHPATASTDATFVFGSLLGDDFVEIAGGGFDLKSSFQNAPLFGGRIGWYGFPLGVEASFVTSKSDLSIGESILTLDSRIMYLEANAMFIILPGRIQPFVTGGGGAHYFRLTDFDDAQVAKFGWNYGFGLKINVSRVAFRFDLRNHRTSFSPDEFDLDPEIIELLGLEKVNLNNVEVSFGVAVRF